MTALSKFGWLNMGLLFGGGLGWGGGSGGLALWLAQCWAWHQQLAP